MTHNIPSTREEWAEHDASIQDAEVVNDAFIDATIGGSIGRRIVGWLPGGNVTPDSAAAQTFYDGLVSQIDPATETLLWAEGYDSSCTTGLLDQDGLARYLPSDGVMPEGGGRNYPAFVVPTSEYVDYRNRVGHWSDGATAQAFLYKKASSLHAQPGSSPPSP